MIPGSSAPDRAALGSHLASCSNCRAYRASLDAGLLGNLLAQTVSPPPPATRPRSQNRQEKPRRWQALLSQVFWYSGIGLLAAIVLAVVITIGWAALSIFHTHQNVQAMIVPTEPAVASSPELRRSS